MKYLKENLLALYSKMLQIRYCEEALVEPIINGEVKCPVHLYSGEEAIATGVCATLNTDDYVFGTHRSHGHFLAKGCSINELVAEIYGKETGCSRGRGGSMHLIDVKNGFIGATPIVAGTISLALGAALSIKIKKEQKVSVCFFGDGATGEGVLYESLNFASLHKLPILFVCENNLYSTHMPIKECRPNEDIYKIAEPFGIDSIKIDGNDVLQVYEKSNEFITNCKNQKGPAFIECLTYRFRGHVGPDDNIQGDRTDIRPRVEIEKWFKKDPILLFEKKLLSDFEVSQQDIELIKNRVNEEVNEAFLFTKNSKLPDKEELSRYVFK